MTEANDIIIGIMFIILILITVILALWWFVGRSYPKYLGNKYLGLTPPLPTLDPPIDPPMNVTPIIRSSDPGIVPPNGSTFQIQQSGTSNFIFITAGSKYIESGQVNVTVGSTYSYFTYKNNFLYTLNPINKENVCLGYYKPGVSETCIYDLSYSSVFCTTQSSIYNTYKYDIKNKTWCLNNNNLPAYCLTTVITNPNSPFQSVYLRKIPSSGPLPEQIWDNILS